MLTRSVVTYHRDLVPLSLSSGVLDYRDMPIEHIVVDGSNIATEGRSLPSLKQLEEAVLELRRDHPNAEITVIVDATFAHRIDPSELARFEQAALRGEYVHPPAGAIGRGDAFLLRVAEKVDATVLSNDSFQEFHGEHPWLFERGRLLGGTPVPGVGWIFSPRQPVRGPRSREATRETVQAKKRVTKAIAVAIKEVVEPAGPVPAAGTSSGRSRSRKSGGAPESERPADGGRIPGKTTPLAVNDPLAFISFIAEHPLGEQVEGEVEGYTSHGAVVRVGEMRCYVPLANLGDPPPRSARTVLKRQERLTFVLTALDPQRRGAELALPGIAHVSGHPREETVAAEVRLAQPPRKRVDALGSQAMEPAKKVSTAQKSTKKPTDLKPALSAASVAGKVSRPAKRTAPAKAPVAEPAAASVVVKKATAKRLTAPKAVVPRPSGKKSASEKAAVAPKAPAAKKEPAAKKAPTAKKVPAPKKVATPKVLAPKSARAPKPVSPPPATQGARRAPSSAGARQPVPPTVAAAPSPLLPMPAGDGPRARRSPRTTANASRSRTSAGGGGRRGTG